MQIHPDRTAVGLTLTAFALLALGVVLKIPNVVFWSGSLLLGLLVARGATLLGVARIRSAGFEMLWRTGERHRRIARRDSVTLKAEIRNRDSRAARFSGLRALASPGLRVQVTPDSGEVPANGRLEVDVELCPLRVGVHAVHGLSLEICGSPGLFDVPLTFANPFAVETLPRAYAILTRSARGGRSRSMAEAGRPGPLSGDSTTLRELREHQPGDPFKRIAWKASARRGTLLVRDCEREERDLLMLVLDASVELWAGQEGVAPLDLAIDELASVALEQLRRGNRVGLMIVAGRVLDEIEAGRGTEHALRLFASLAHSTQTLDADRSGLDETDIAYRVLEHLRPLEPVNASNVGRHDTDAIAKLARDAIPRAPISLRTPRAPSERERILRHYMGAFGLGSPARLEPDRPTTDQLLVKLLRDLPGTRERPTQICVWSPAPLPGTRRELEQTLSKRSRKGAQLVWIRMRHEPSVPTSGGPMIAAAAAAVSIRTRVAEARGLRFLRSCGVRIDSPSKIVSRARMQHLAASTPDDRIGRP